MIKSEQEMPYGQTLSLRVGDGEVNKGPASSCLAISSVSCQVKAVEALAPLVDGTNVRSLDSGDSWQ
jgi:hypothetical protein